MPRFNINAIITVPGVKSPKEAINELQVMLNDYEDNNSEHGKDISIHINGAGKAVATGDVREEFIENSHNALGYMKKTAIGHIAGLLLDKGVDVIHATDIDEGSSPVVLEDEYADDLSYTLDRICVRKSKTAVQLAVQASNCCETVEVNAATLPVDRLIDILKWLYENQDKIVKGE